jgi:hypothetical protein
VDVRVACEGERLTVSIVGNGVRLLDAIETFGQIAGVDGVVVVVFHRA